MILGALGKSEQKAMYTLVSYALCTNGQIQIEVNTGPSSEM